ncbi:hypothetical protein [Herbiconiux sp. UC225_62]|uniref:hypothetical protein n=1 Tax=Herbiconiux sp. UC225_62 TaxID=3350168 RepID=UPI0036D30805
MTYFDDRLSGVRVEGGECGGKSATIETSADGGVSWVASDLGGLVLSDVLSVTLSGEFQVDIVGKLGSDCSVGMVTSYTGGQFWAVRTDALSEATYFDADANVIHDGGSTVANPCSSPLVVRSFDSDSTLVCDDGVLAITEARTIAVVQRPGVLDGEVVGDQTAVAIDDPSTCDGVLVSVTGNTTSAVLGQSCLAADATSGVSIAANGQLVRLWVGSVVYESEDRGTSWTQL